MRTFDDYLARRKIVHGIGWDSSDLAEQFVPYFESGERIEVKFENGEVKRGTVGVTSGWKPVFLLMLTRRSIGSAYRLRHNDCVIKVIERRHKP